MLTFTYIALLLLYSFLLGLLFRWWRQIEMPKAAGGSETGTNLFSIVVVIRNEEASIQPLLRDLQQQNFPANQYEIIVVDDHSTDASGAIVERVSAESTVAIRLLSLREQTGKKAGLQLGVQQAKGEIVVVTDGDCRVPEGWLKTYARFFGVEKSQFVSGPVTYLRSSNFFEKLQEIEFASLVGSGAALLQAGFPGMCNAANMAFHKKAFQEAALSRTDFHIPSGDDEFLLQAIYNKYPRQVHFLKSPEAVVRTRAQSSWSTFVQQRKRWAGKWKLHRKPAVAFTALFLFLFYAAWLGLQVTLLLEEKWFLFFGGALLKFGLEFLFLQDVSGLMGKRLPLLPFLFLQLLYPFYVLYFGVAVNFGSFSWKGRTYKYAGV